METNKERLRDSMKIQECLSKYYVTGRPICDGVVMTGEMKDGKYVTEDCYCDYCKERRNKT